MNGSTFRLKVSFVLTLSILLAVPSFSLRPRQAVQGLNPQIGPARVFDAFRFPPTLLSLTDASLWTPDLFELDWGDWDNDNKVTILDAAQLAYCFDSIPSSPLWSSCKYWDLYLQNKVTILDAALVAFLFDKTFTVSPYPGQNRSPGLMDLYWTSVCSLLPQGDQSYCALLPTLTAISVTPSNLAVRPGWQGQFVATGTYSEGSTSDLTPHVLWTSSDATIVTVSNQNGSVGFATAVGVTHGTASVTATLGTTVGSTPLTVNCLYHSNGLGQNYDDCAPLGIPGNASTYTNMMASEATVAWMGYVTGTGQCHDPQSGLFDSALYAQTSTSAAVWVYTGISLAGRVKLNVQSTTPICPSLSDATWN